MLGTVEDLVRQSRDARVDVIVVALPLAAADRIARILAQIGSTVADVCLTTDLAGLHYAGRQFERIGANAVVSIKEDPLKDWRAVRKAVFDRTLAALLLLLAGPVMLAIAALIRLDSPGPVLFRQPRLGFNNRLFRCFKFRTMHDAMADPLADRQATRDDPRVTRVGRWLRRSSLDELPQLFNVLGGTMSLVGPRPHAPEHPRRRAPVRRRRRALRGPPPRQAGHHRLGAGQRPARRDPDRSRDRGPRRPRPALHRALVDAVRPADLLRTALREIGADGPTDAFARARSGRREPIRMRQDLLPYHHLVGRDPLLAHAAVLDLGMAQSHDIDRRTRGPAEASESGMRAPQRPAQRHPRGPPGSRLTIALSSANTAPGKAAR